MKSPRTLRREAAKFLYGIMNTERRSPGWKVSNLGLASSNHDIHNLLCAMGLVPPVLKRVPPKLKQIIKGDKR